MAFQEIHSPGRGNWQASVKPGERVKRGRPASAEMQAEYGREIAEYLSKGMYFDTACALAGIQVRSAHNWLRKGRNDYDADVESPESEFYELVQWGNAKFEELMHDKLDNAAQRDPKAWGATAFRLERRLPDKYGKVDKSKVEVTGAMGVGIATLPAALSDSLDTPEKISAAKAIGGILSTLGSGGRPASIRDDSE